VLGYVQSRLRRTWPIRSKLVDTVLQSINDFTDCPELELLDTLLQSDPEGSDATLIGGKTIVYVRSMYKIVCTCELYLINLVIVLFFSCYMRADCLHQPTPTQSLDKKCRAE
jgi:hypothetical protein